MQKESTVLHSEISSVPVYSFYTTEGNSNKTVKNFYSLQFKLIYLIITCYAFQSLTVQSLDFGRE